jgi:hypothetical protein
MEVCAWFLINFRSFDEFEKIEKNICLSVLALHNHECHCTLVPQQIDNNAESVMISW